MQTVRINPIAAFEIHDGVASRISGDHYDLDKEEGYAWIHLDLDDPGLTTWAKSNLPHVAAGSLWQSDTRPRCERFEDGLILNLRGVNLNPGSDPEDMVSVRMWVTRSVIVSARVRKVFALDAIRQSAEQGKAPATIGRFLAELTSKLLSRIETVANELEEQTDEFEERVLSKSKIPVGDVSKLRQTIIKIRRFINPQREAISNLALLDDWILSDEELALVNEQANRIRRIVEGLDALRDRLSAIQDHMEADRSNALSRNSYILSVVAAIFLPLGFLTGLFGVNVAGMPGTEAPSAFWLLTIASIISGLLLFVIFKFSKWL